VFELLGLDNTQRFRLAAATELGSNTWRVGAPGFDPISPGVDTGIPVNTAFHVDLRLKLPARTYDLILSPIGGGAPLFTQTNGFLTNAADIGALRFTVDTGSSADGSQELFLNNLQVDIPEPTALAPLAALALAALTGRARRRRGA
jgi:hypothetical protein